MKLILLSLLFFSNAFGQDFLPVDKISPFTGESYSHIKIGPAYETGRFGKKYLNRAITIYNIHTSEERLADAPSFQENCYDEGDRFANWSYSKSYERSISLGLSFNLLGIDIGSDGSLTRTVEFAIERWVIATFGVKAVHTPYIRYESYHGETYLQQINLKTQKAYFEKLKNPLFKINYLNPIIFVKRNILETCE